MSMNRDQILKEMNDFGDWLGRVDEQIQGIADREASGAWAAHPDAYSDPQLAKVKDGLIGLSDKIVKRMKALHDDLMQLP